MWKIFVVCLVCASALTGQVRPADAESASTALPSVLFGQKRFALARKAYEAAIQHYPARMDLRQGLVRTLLRLDQWQEALKDAREAVQRAPRNADVQGLYGLAAMRAGDPETAASAAATALALNPNSYWALIVSGRISLWNDRAALARRYFRQAAQLRPQEPDAWLGFLLSGNESSSDEEEMKAAQTYLRLAPAGQPHVWMVPAIKLLLKNWPALRHTYGRVGSFGTVMPRPGAASLAPGNKGTDAVTSVPLQRRRQGLFIPVQINGQVLHLLFDTGGGRNLVLSKAAAKRVHLPVLAHLIVSGLQGTQSSDCLYAARMRIGVLTLRSIPMDAIDRPAGEGDGIFGGAILNKYRVTLDLLHDRMLLFGGPIQARSASAPETASIVVPFHNLGNNVILPVQADGEKGWALFDTGADESYLSMRFAKSLAAQPPKVKVLETTLNGSFGIGGSRHLRAAGFEKPIRVSLGPSSEPSFRLGPADTVVGIAALDDDINPAQGFESSLLLGLSFLNQFASVTIDYPGHVLRFVPTVTLASKEKTADNPTLDPAQLPPYSIEQGYRWVWWSDQWVQLPQGTKLAPVAPAAQGQVPPFQVPLGYRPLQYKPQEPGERWMLVPQTSGAVSGDAVTVQ